MSDWREDARKQREAIDEELNRLGVKVESAFIPFSMSRSANDSYVSLNWRVTVKHGQPAKPVHTFDYTAGAAHTKSYKLDQRNKFAIKEECERNQFNVKPDPRDVFYSLLSDASFVAYSFEDFCAELGYDEDSRKAYEIFKQTQETARKLRNAFGDETLERLRELFADY
jgi:hypothetical protein